MEGSGAGGALQRGSRWVWATTVPHSGVLPSFTDAPESAVPPQIEKLLSWHLFLRSFLCRFGLEGSGESCSFASEWNPWRLPWR